MSEPMSCRTCREGLAAITNPFGLVTYKHNAELVGDRSKPDHIAMPVPESTLGDPVRRCDFCNRVTPNGWIYCSAEMQTDLRQATRTTVSTQEYHHRNRASQVHASGSRKAMRGDYSANWGACDDCAESIEKRDIYELISKVTATMSPARLRGKRLTLIRGVLHGNYTTLFANLVGQRTRYEAPAAVSGEDSA